MARYLINTSDVSQIKQFYLNLGFSFKEIGEKSLFLSYPNSPSILLNEISENNSDYLDKFYIEIKPNKTNIYINQEDINVLQNTCNTYNINWELEENDFEVKIKLKDPFLNKLVFTQQKVLSDKKIMFLYEKSQSLFMQMLLQLEEKHMEFKTIDTGWSIFTTLNHVIEVESYNLTIIKYAVAENGRDYNSNLYDCDVWAENLRYENAIPLELISNYFFSQREYISYLLKNKNYPFDNYLMNDSKVIKIRDILKFIASHTMNHTLEIQKIIYKEGVEINE